MIALFREIIDKFSSKIFLIFLSPVSCKNKAMSASCPLKKVDSSSRFPSLCLSSLELFSVLFCGQAGRVRCIVICINPAPNSKIDGTENPFEVCKRAGRNNEFGYNACGCLVVFVVVVNICY